MSARFFRGPFRREPTAFASAAMLPAILSTVSRYSLASCVSTGGAFRSAILFDLEHDGLVSPHRDLLEVGQGDGGLAAARDREEKVGKLLALLADGRDLLDGRLGRLLILERVGAKVRHRIIRQP